MGHYDSDYEHQHQIEQETKRKNAEKQLALMENFYMELSRVPGKRGISQRHLDAFQDMLNETKLRTQ